MKITICRSPDVGYLASLSILGQQIRSENGVENAVKAIACNLQK